MSGDSPTDGRPGPRGSGLRLTSHGRHDQTHDQTHDSDHDPNHASADDQPLDELELARALQPMPVDAPVKPARRFASPLQQLLGLSVSLVLIYMIFGRGAVTPPSTTAVAPITPSPRVASTSPAISDSLIELGLGAHIVGRSPYCTGVDSSVPVVGDLRDFDAERLALVHPDVLFVQPPLAGVDPALREFCAKNSIRLVERRLDALQDIALLADDFQEVFGAQLAPKLADARTFIATNPTARADAPRVLIIVSADPFLAVGRGNYIDQLLQRCGFINAVDGSGWVELSVEAIIALRPARIVGIAQTRATALEIEGVIEVLPWPNGPPAIACDAMPELLSPSLAAIAKRAAFAQLLGSPVPTTAPVPATSPEAR